MKFTTSQIISFVCLVFFLLFVLSALGLFPFVNEWYRSKYWFYNNAQIIGEFQGRTADPLLGSLIPAKTCKDNSDCGGGNCLFIADEGTSFHKIPCHKSSTCSGRCDPLRASPGVRRVVKKGRLSVSTN